MTSPAISHISLVAGPEMPVIESYLRSWDFTKVPGGEDATVMRQGNATLVVERAQELYRVHGTHVRSITLAVDDVSASAGRAEQAGAYCAEDQPGEVVFRVPALGDVEHRLVPRQSHDPRDTNAGDPLFRTIDHFVPIVAAGDLERLAEFYLDAFGVFQIEDYSDGRIRLEEHGLRSLVVGDESTGLRIVIAEPVDKGGVSHLTEFLERNSGPGIQHIAFETADAGSAVDILRRNQVQFIDVPPSYYQALASRLPELAGLIPSLREKVLLADGERAAFLLQTFAKPLSPRRTLFFEVLQRHNWSGLGEGNFQALYEAYQQENEAAASQDQ